MRYLPHTDTDRRAMLDVIGAETVEALFVDVPERGRLRAPLDLPDHAGELEVQRHIGTLAARNLSADAAPFFLGAGAYRHHVPAAVDALIQRGEFLTAYTPYQPEVAQGTLQAMYEFQTQVALLSGMDVANASMYDGSSASAEAVLMAARITRRDRAVVSGGLHPHYRETVATLAGFHDIAVHDMPPGAPSGKAHGTGALEDAIDDRTACVLVQYPDMFGEIRDFSSLAEACHAAGALLIVAVLEPVALGLLKSPGAMGADIVAGEGQGLGVGLNFGGPYVGLMATRQRFVRQMPGRLVGETLDADGRRGWVLTLSAREQHIRREKATSNICTNSGLCALAFTIHMALLGEAGLVRLARLNHAAAIDVADRLDAVPGVAVLNHGFFNEFTVRLPRPAAPVVDRLAAMGVLGGVPVSRLLPDRDDLADLLLVTATEMNSDADKDRLVAALSDILKEGAA